MLITIIKALTPEGYFAATVNNNGLQIFIPFTSDKAFLNSRVKEAKERLKDGDLNSYLSL